MHRLGSTAKLLRSDRSKRVFILAFGSAILGSVIVTSIPQNDCKEVRFRQLLKLCLPHSAQLAEESGIDSDFVRWVGDGVTVQIDYGLFSDPLISPPQQASVSQEAIDDRDARIVSYQQSDGTSVSAAHFSRLGGSDPRKKLTITVQAKQRDVPLKIIKSVKFL